MIFWSIFLPGLAVVLIVYFSWWPELHKRGPRDHHKIDKNITAGPLPHEYKLTALSLCVFSMIGMLTGYCIDNGLTQTLPSGALTINTFAAGLGAFFLAAILHDFYFYITHRVLHWGPMFRIVHELHHRSHDTNPWSAFSFHPLEGVIQFGIIPIVAFAIPMTETTLTVFAVYLLLMTVYGHSGYELRSGRMKVFRFFNTSYHHFMHHRFANCNYGIYLNIWDRLLRTNHHQYEKSLDELATRISSGTEQSG